MNTGMIPYRDYPKGSKCKEMTLLPGIVNDVKDNLPENTFQAKSQLRTDFTKA